MVEWMIDFYEHTLVIHIIGYVIDSILNYTNYLNVSMITLYFAG